VIVVVCAVTSLCKLPDLPYYMHAPEGWLLMHEIFRWHQQDDGVIWKLEVSWFPYAVPESCFYQALSETQQCCVSD